MSINFTDDELSAIAAALRIAAEVYERDAATSDKIAQLADPACAVGHTRVVRQFNRQRDKAIALSDRIESRP